MRLQGNGWPMALWKGGDLRTRSPPAAQGDQVKGSCDEACEKVVVPCCDLAFEAE